jgi:hypothetical protein
MKIMILGESALVEGGEEGDGETDMLLMIQRPRK